MASCKDERQNWHGTPKRRGKVTIFGVVSTPPEMGSTFQNTHEKFTGSCPAKNIYARYKETSECSARFLC